MTLERTVLDFPIRVEIKKLNEGWDVGIFGGCTTHVGAVSLAASDGTVETLERPGHKDGVISAQWASELAVQLDDVVCVRCGIHYDNAEKAQLTAIVDACEDLLRKAKEKL
jgi:hypothetical protein